MSLGEKDKNGSVFNNDKKHKYYFKVEGRKRENY